MIFYQRNWFLFHLLILFNEKAEMFFSAFSQQNFNNIYLYVFNNVLSKYFFFKFYY